MNNHKVLIATSSFSSKQSPLIGLLEKNLIQVCYNPYQRRITEHELSGLLSEDVVGVVAGLEPYSDKILQNTDQLKVISRCGIATDNVSLSVLNTKKISLYNTPDAPSQAVAELTIGLMLSMLRHISYADKGVRSQQWKATMGSLLYGKKVGLVGYGRIGKKVATILGAFGVNLLIHDPYNEVQQASGHQVDLNQLLCSTDIVSLHCPSSKKTDLMMSEKTISMMRPGSYIVNTSRGSLIDEYALVSAIKSGHIAGAGLDVYQHEPYHGPLCDLDQVVLTSHMGSYAKESRLMMEEEALSNLCHGLKKHNLLSKAVQYNA